MTINHTKNFKMQEEEEQKIGKNFGLKMRGRPSIYNQQRVVRTNIFCVLFEKS